MSLLQPSSSCTHCVLCTCSLSLADGTMVLVLVPHWLCCMSDHVQDRQRGISFCRPKFLHSLTIDHFVWCSTDDVTQLVIGSCVGG